MKKLFSILFILSLSVGLTSCYEDIISPGTDPNGPPQDISLSGDLVPIYAKNCAMSGCHDANGKKPSLVADKIFNDLMSGGYVNTTVPDKSPIYTVSRPGGSMPTLTPKDQQKVLDWIRNGAPNN